MLHLTRRSYTFYLVLIPLILLMLTPVVYSSNLALGIFSAKYFWLYFLALLLIPLLIYQSFAQSNSLNRTDYLLIIFVVYILIQSYVLNNGFSMNKKVTWLLDSVLVYLYIRCIQRLKGGYNVLYFLLLTVFTCVIIAAIAAVLQQAGIISSFNAYYPVTGTFFHPAVLAGFAATVFPLSFYCCFSTLKYGTDDNYLYLLKWLSGITSGIILLIILPIANSRAAFLSLAGGTAYILLNTEKVKTWLSHFNGRKKSLFLAAIFIILIPCSFFIYRLRPASVEGRLLVWKISLQMLKDKPLTGHGIESFKYSYPNYQIAFFKSGKATETERFLSDEVTGTFNEPLQLSCELGITGILIIILLLVSIFKAVPPRVFRENARPVVYRVSITGARGALLAFILFSLFSYPFSLPELTLVFFTLLALANGGGINEPSAPRRKRILYPLFVCLLSAGIISQLPRLYHQLLAYNKWFIAGSSHDPEESRRIYASVFPVLKDNDLYLSAYAGDLSGLKQYDSSIFILGLKKGKTYNDLMCLADNYKAINNNEQAIKYYQEAYYLLPHKFYPLYFIMTITRYSNPAKAKLVARQISDMKIKVQTPEVLAIKNEARSILDL
ncbi:O-antigen ligase [Chitinophaga niastensis]|uniref:O-antigen ligase n=1 Tax=Chitinophaga niastensis TaxID=536980 RepID=A0A2P8HJZ2_CHINA|nr:O-antigen ligase family protein [Chitinophaga niastensis]PSL46534.1 O-antigen ligase [Chitinophaga niastensis]